ncbi:MAG: tetratricopeptide repeat protein [Steroidobacteraceae bacterium]
MSLTPAQFAQAAALETRELRMRRLARMSYGELHALLSGDPAEAARWVGSAAESGVPAAQLRLGRMLLEGKGVPQDRAGARHWFARAAESGDAEGLNMLGRCYENGWGAAIDLLLAAANYRRSARAGHDWGQYNLGNLLFDGRGVERDRPQALRWYLCAARQGHGRAMNLIGRCFEEGWGCLRSRSDACYWYRRSAHSGYFRGQFNHAMVLMECGLLPLAADWFLRAAAQDNDDIRRAVVTALAEARDPALMLVCTQVRSWSASTARA